MDFLPLIPFLTVSIPESLVLYYMIAVIAARKESPLLIAALSIPTSLFSFFVRSIPLAFGIHTLLQIVLMVILTSLIFHLSFRAALTAMVLAGLVLGLAEGISVPILSWIFSIELNQIISNPLLRMVFTLPHLLLLAVLTFFIGKRKWRPQFIERMLEVGNNPFINARSTLRSQTYLFILCLVQALMLILLRISYLIYSSGVYPTFTLNTLITINNIVLIISVLATLFIAGYLLKLTEREAKTKAELACFKERHNLNIQLQIERHDFYNHVTAIYGFLKADQKVNAVSYIEGLYQTLSHLKELLSVEPPELGALLSVKQEEAKSKGIEFTWYINMESNTIPLSPEELTHVIGNLLDNALEGTENSNKPQVDLMLTSNKLGLLMKVSNSCNSIADDIRKRIFKEGYTTKDTTRHSGLGLYIIRHIIDRHGGQVQLGESENYSGIQFEIFIPWSK